MYWWFIKWVTLTYCIIYLNIHTHNKLSTTQPPHTQLVQIGNITSAGRQGSAGKGSKVRV